MNIKALTKNLSLAKTLEEKYSIIERASIDAGMDLEKTLIAMDEAKGAVSDMLTVHIERFLTGTHKGFSILSGYFSSSMITPIASIESSRHLSNTSTNLIQVAMERCPDTAGALGSSHIAMLERHIACIRKTMVDAEIQADKGGL